MVRVVRNLEYLGGKIGLRESRNRGFAMGPCSKALLDAIEASGRRVRRWTASDGLHVGIFRSKVGNQWYAVGHFSRYGSMAVVYRTCCQPE